MRFSITNSHRSALLAVLTLLIASDAGLAAPRGRAIGRWRSNYNYDPVRDLGVDTGAFSGPYQGGGYGPLYRNYNYWPNYYYGGYGYPVYPDPSSPGYSTPSAPVTEQRSYYPPQQPVAPAPTTATIDLYVPASAEVWLNGQKTNQSGTLRRFVTPPLNANAHSTYELRVRYTGQDGKVVDETREVAVEAGQQVVLNLQPAPKK